MKLYFPTFLVIAILIFSGCKSNSTKDITNEKADTNKMSKSAGQEESVKKIFFNLPSPIELSQTVLSAHVPFRVELLNPVSNLENYSSSSSLALNFGVYGADLCYCRVYEQLQESIKYLSIIKKITGKLQIPEEEGSETINRIEESIDNRDSVFQIIAESYANADGYLKENEREMTSVFILIGGWVEGMYFAVNMIDPAAKNEKIFQRIAEQKYSLDNLISITSKYSDDKTIRQILIPLNQLKDIYNTIEISRQKPVVVTDQEVNVTSIDNATVININKKQIDEITHLINKIRGIIIS